MDMRCFSDFLPRLVQAFVLAVVLCLATPFVASTSHAAIIRDTEIEHYLLSIARPMAEEAGIDAESLKIRIIISPGFNAFVTGEDIIFINSGLLLDTESVLEVAGVIAHEIGHLASGHVQRRGEVISNAQGATVLGAVAAIALTATGNGAAAIGAVIGGADQTNRIILHQSRQDESVADEWAIRLMDKLMFSTRPMARMMKRLASERLLPVSRQSQYYQTHPGARERSIVFETHAASLAYADEPPPMSLSEAFARIQAKLSGWVNPTTQVLIGDVSEGAHSAELKRYQRAIALFRLSDILAATEEMQGLVRDYPDNPFYHEFLGDILLSSGQAPRAVDEYKTALGLLGADVNQGQILVSLGRALVAIGDDESLGKAIPVLEEADGLEPRWGLVKHQLGISYGRLGRVVEADLVLAERALMMGNFPLATQLAGRVTSSPDATAIQKQLARDIIVQTEL